MTIKNAAQTVEAGDVIYLEDDMPTQWKNTGKGAARLLWVKIL